MALVCGNSFYKAKSRPHGRRLDGISFCFWFASIMWCFFVRFLPSFSSESMFCARVPGSLPTNSHAIEPRPNSDGVRIGEAGRSLLTGDTRH